MHKTASEKFTPLKAALLASMISIMGVSELSAAPPADAPGQGGGGAPTAAGGGASAANALYIEYAFVDFGYAELEIQGAGFSTATEPSVTLGGQLLQVNSWTENTIIAALPNPTDDGDHLLVVNNNEQPASTASFMLTIGAVGPIGPKGDKGDTGDVGPQGIQGEKGDTGAMGPYGPRGPTGPMGPMGPMGPQGPTGSMGPMGRPGMQGPAGPRGPQGYTGPRGEKGDPGVAGINVHECALSDKRGEVSSICYCPSGEQIISGGCWNSRWSTRLVDSYPLDNGWRCTWKIYDTANTKNRIICADLN